MIAQYRTRHGAHAAHRMGIYARRVNAARYAAEIMAKFPNAQAHAQQYEFAWAVRVYLPTGRTRMGGQAPA